MENVKLIIGKEYVTNIAPILDSAKNNIDIVVFDFRLYPDQVGSAPFKLLETLKAAQRRGVKIRILTMRLESVGVLKQLGFMARHWQGGKTLHSKFFIVDGKTAVLGSHNWTMNALTLNYETSVICESCAAVNLLQNFFESLWSV